MLNATQLPLEVAAIVAGITAAAAVIDYRQHKIPNYLTVPAAIVGLAYSLLSGWIGPASACAGLVVGFLVLLTPWILGGGGMGDVKLLAALGAWLGPFLILVVFAGAVMTAAFMAISIMTYTALSLGISSTKERYLATAGAGHASSSNQPRPTHKRVLPFAVPIAISTWCVLGWLLMN